MSGIHTTSGVPQQPTTTVVLEACYRELIVLGFGSLGYEVEQADGDLLKINIPADHRRSWDDQPEIYIALEASEAPAKPANVAPPLLAKLRQLLDQKSPALHAAPAEQPTNVHQLADSIYAPYQVDNGRARLSGCTLEPRPYLRLTWPTEGHALKHSYFDHTGTPLDSQLVEQLGMDHLEALPAPQAPLPEEKLTKWIRQSKSSTSSATSSSKTPSSGFPWATIIWCRYASGKLIFEIGQEMVTLNFAGWASDIVAGRTPMPLYHCPLTGRESYHLVADDEARLTVAEAVALCEVSQRRVIETDLEICQETGKRALKEYLATCEQTHRRVLKSLLRWCDMCQRQLASVSLVRDRCEACRHLTPVSKDDPTLARLLHQYAKLDSWKHWRISETPRLFIFTAASWTQRLLLVVEKESLEVFRIATRGRFGQHWLDAPPKLLEELTS